MTYLKKNPHLFILGLIILLGLFFRTYKLVDWFQFAHDGDLYSWIVKDIAVNHHLRLIGQLTSAPGIFIGPLFYYLLVPFFLLFNMNPMAAAIPLTILSLFTIFSFYFVFSKIFNKNVGLIAAFLQAILPSQINFDRWVVPTNPTVIWLVWYLYTVVLISRGNYQILPLLGLLVGLIWHIHIALVPTLLAIPISVIVSKKLPGKSQLLWFLISLLVTSAPLIFFELRHNYQQTLSFINNLTVNHGGETGLAKLNLVYLYIVGNMAALFLPDQLSDLVNHKLFALLLLFTTTLLVWKKELKIKDFWPFLAWFLGVVGFFSFSSSPISEYYFKSLDILFITVASLGLYLIFKFSKYLLFVLLGVFLIFVTVNFLTTYHYPKGLVQRRAVVKYIAEDARIKNYPCVAVSYISAPGENVGFRYLFWLNKLHVNSVKTGGPVYTIVLPDEYVLNGEIKAKFGKIGVIPPSKVPSKAELNKLCSGPDENLTSPLLGYTQ